MRSPFGNERGPGSSQFDLLCARAAILAVSAMATGVGAGCASGGNDEAGGAGGATSVATSASTTAASTVTASGGPTTSSASSSSTSTSSSSSSASSASSTGSGTTCGNGIIEPPEQCEGDDFGGKTCATFGLSGGTLTCNTFCGIVVSNCTPAETCGDGIDNDEDGDTDCDDSDCASEVACTDACVAPTVVSVPSFNSLAIDGRPDLLTLSCSPGGGREMVFQFTAVADSDMVARVSFSSFDASLSVRTTCDDGTSEIACANQSGSGGQEIINFPAQTGVTYYAVVESVTNAEGFFELDVEQVLPEQFCFDLNDDDFDGYVDCDDPTACQGTPDCAPGSGVPGTPCFSQNDCDSTTHGDPVCLPDFMGWPHGYCSEFCDLATNDCPGNDQCKQIGISHDGVCLQSCVTALDCSPGYACTEEGFSTKVCDRFPEVSCNDDQDNDHDGLEDCEDPSSCQSSPACVPGPGAPGTPCQLHNECAATNANDPFCIDQFNFSAFAGGYCSEFCDPALNDCPSGSTCSTTHITFASGHGLCMQTCSVPGDCRPGYFCDPFENICAP